MTATEAFVILQKPIFGHPVCIDAKHVLEMAEELVAARMWANRRGFETPFIPAPVEMLEHDQISTELTYWTNCGWEVNK
jgi:hypothetical protein